MNQHIIEKRNRANHAIYAEAEKVVKKVNTLLETYRVDHLAEDMGMKPETLSRFINMHDGYVTKSMVDRVKNYLSSID